MNFYFLCELQHRDVSHRDVSSLVRIKYHWSYFETFEKTLVVDSDKVVIVDSDKCYTSTEGL